MGIRTALPDIAHWKAQVKCQAGCPVSTDAGRYVQLIAEGRLEEAFLVARAPNPLASVCGRVCAAPCEDACRRVTPPQPVLDRIARQRRDGVRIVQGGEADGGWNQHGASVRLAPWNPSTTR